MRTIDLSGKWQTTINGQTIDFMVPGTSCENKIGKENTWAEKFTKESVRTAIEKYEYIGELTLVKEIEIPEETKNSSVKLFFERINVSSKIYLDGLQVGREVFSLSTPHVYDLTGKVEPGKHLLRVVLDNSDKLSLSNMSSGYSADTQGFWNGIIGKVELIIENKSHIESVDVYPKADGSLDFKFLLTSEISAPEKYQVATLLYSVETPDGIRLPEVKKEIKLFSAKHYWYDTYQLKKQPAPIKYWDEFDPNLYTVNVKLIIDGQTTDEKEVCFGFRYIETEGKNILLNGKKIAIRGNVDCAQFPKTGYPPMDRPVWEHNLSAMKDWGLNMVRFHAWCPPEVAFEVADELGMYLQVEMPMWLNVDVTPLQLMSDPIHESFFAKEAEQIIKTYGNHPSFVFFSNGNENMGDYALLEDITRKLKSLDNRHLYALTSNFDHPVGPVEDYFLAMNAFEKPVRIQHLHDLVAKDTRANFDEVSREMPIPFMSFEVGQYGVYPDVDIIEKYDGNILASNFDAIKKNMLETGVYEKRQDYIKASGDLCARLYKEDVEAVYRTKEMSGYQLLCLQDYSGQYTATVGMLDVMYNEKGIIEKDTWREFVGPVVPLFRANRIFTNSETLNAELDLYDYGKEKIANPVFDMKIFCHTKENSEVFFEKKTLDSLISIDLSDIKSPSRLEVVVTVENHSNRWNVYVFPDNQGEAMEAESVKLNLENPCPSSYIPVFWSPVMFETDKPSGAIIDEKHEIFSSFPTEKYPDYQWKTLLDNAIAMDAADLDFIPESIVELVPNYMCNKRALVLFEGEYEGKKAIYNGFDLSCDDIPTKQLKRSINEYAAKNGLILVNITCLGDSNNY